MYENLTHKELCEAFHTDEKNGLTEKEAQNRLLRDGSNTLKKPKNRPFGTEYKIRLMTR